MAAICTQRKPIECEEGRATILAPEVNGDDVEENEFVTIPLSRRVRRNEMEMRDRMMMGNGGRGSHWLKLHAQRRLVPYPLRITRASI